MTGRLLVVLISTLTLMASCERHTAPQTQSKTGERVVLSVLGMHCSSCEDAISQHVMRCEGVNAAAPSATQEQVVLWVAPGADLEAIRSKIRSLGFTVEPHPAE